MNQTSLSSFFLLLVKIRSISLGPEVKAVISSGGSGFPSEIRHIQRGGVGGGEVSIHSSAFVVCSLGRRIPLIGTRCSSVASSIEFLV